MNALDLRETSFHDSGLLDLNQTGNTITLTLENVLVGDSQKNVQVKIAGVDKIVRNGDPIDELRMEKESGEVLTLRQEGKQVSLVIQWDDFKARTHEVIAYTLGGPDISLNATRTRGEES